MFLKSTTAQFGPPCTVTQPASGVTEKSSQPAAGISVTWCMPGVTLSKRTRPSPAFCLGLLPSRRNVNCATGLISLPLMSNVSLITSIQPAPGIELMLDAMLELWTLDATELDGMDEEGTEEAGALLDGTELLGTLELGTLEDMLELEASVWMFLKRTTTQFGPGKTLTRPASGVTEKSAQPAAGISVTWWMPTGTLS